jgi:hypothetical protein
VKLGPAPAVIAAPKVEPDGLAPIPLDTSPLTVASAAPAQIFAPQRAAAPVRRLTGIGGMCLGAVFELQPGQHVIGRVDAELLLADDNQVSRRHAQLTIEPDGMATLSDLGSTNGTFVNNQRVQSIQLCPGDVVQIGTSSFKVEG